MKRYVPLVFTSLIFIASCKETPPQLLVRNDSTTDFAFKEVVLTATELSQYAMGDGLPTVSYMGTLIPSQLDDLDGDGQWDELVFQVSVRKGEEKHIQLNWVKDSDYPSFDPMTAVYLGYSPNRDNNFVSVENHVRPSDHIAQSTPFLYQFEGVGWESNKVAFRSYFDSRNGKDIFGKKVEESLIEKIGTGENYHELQPWGMDVLKVGSSLGAGALAIMKKDSLVRLGDTDYAEFKKIAEGPVRSIFQLIYRGWDVMGESYALTEEITISANNRWYKSNIAITPASSDTLVTGIVNLKSAEVFSFTEGKSEILYTHGRQGENKDMLGMGIIVPQQYFAGIGKAPEAGEGITNTELVMLQPQEDRYTFYFYAGWEGENASFADADYMKSQLSGAASQIEGELTVSMK